MDKLKDEPWVVLVVTLINAFITAMTWIFLFTAESVASPEVVFTMLSGSLLWLTALVIECKDLCYEEDEEITEGSLVMVILCAILGIFSVIGIFSESEEVFRAALFFDALIWTFLLAVAVMLFVQKWKYRNKHEVSVSQS